MSGEIDTKSRCNGYEEGLRHFGRGDFFKARESMVSEDSPEEEYLRVIMDMAEQLPFLVYGGEPKKYYREYFLRLYRIADRCPQAAWMVAEYIECYPLEAAEFVTADMDALRLYCVALAAQGGITEAVSVLAD